MGRTGQRYRAGERAQVAALVALLLPVLLGLGSIVMTVGNWYAHGRHLQTKADAAALAGGGAWGFPCGPDIDALIEAEARQYAGNHTAVDGSVSSGGYNPQLGNVDGDQIYVALNQAQYWDGSFGAVDFSAPSGPVCDAKVLDVKVTEESAPLIWGLLPFSPDIKRKARVEVQEVEGLTGLLPIAVRLPQPLSAAAVFYDEGDVNKSILDVRYFRQVCTQTEPSCLFGAPPGLGQWTTDPAAGSGATWASFPVAGKTGVIVATSVRPGCGTGTPPAGAPCLEDSGWVGKPIDDFCRQASGTVRCYDAAGVGSAQTARSGVHFIRGYPNGTVSPGPNLPDLRGAWLENVNCPASGYFNSTPSSCDVELNVRIDVGSCLRGPGECFDDPGVAPPEETRQASADAAKHNVQARYCLVREGQTGTVCDTQFGEAQELSCSGGPGQVSCATSVGTHPRITPASGQNAFAIEVRLRRTSVTGFPECQADGDFKDTCRFFFTGAGYAGDSVLPNAAQILAAPVQRSFMGDFERTTPLKWLRLTVDADCNLLTFDDRIIDGITGHEAASQPAGQVRCYVVDLGMAGGLARDQDEPPIAFNLGDNSSQRAYVDCDPTIPNIKSEIVSGCGQPSYAVNKFNTSPTCPGPAGFFVVPKPAPFNNWPPFRCVLTQTGNSNQVLQGFNDRIFGKVNNPKCPGDDVTQYVKGRNYWHRDNNDYDDATFAWDGDTPLDASDNWGNKLRSDDPRLVTLFFTSYDSFTSTGNEVYAIVGFGNFYVTGYGTTQNGAVALEDPCGDGNDGDLTNGNGNEPPPDLDLSRNTRWVWGHFVKDVTPDPLTTGGSGVLCNPEASFQPCVAILVE